MRINVRIDTIWTRFGTPCAKTTHRSIQITWSQDTELMWSKAALWLYAKSSGFLPNIWLSAIMVGSFYREMDLD